jgi:tryptophan-rich sensory protein
MDFADVNYIAVIVAAVAGFAVGAVWYALLFSKPWLAAVGFTEEDVKQGRSPLPFVFSAIGLLIMAWVLSTIVAPADGIGRGIIVGLLLWLGFTATTTVVNYAYAARKPMLMLIDGGHWLAVAVVMGAIIGAF